MLETEKLTLDISQSIEVRADIGDVYAALIRRLTSENTTPDNHPLTMVLEEWPGGRWFRDLGAGQGHLWGHVQVIKPPNLIEITGPLFMSYAVAGHIQFRLTPVSSGVELTLRHRVLGLVEEGHREGVNLGWNHLLEKVKQSATVAGN